MSQAIPLYLTRLALFRAPAAKPAPIKGLAGQPIALSGACSEPYREAEGLLVE